MDRSLLRFPAIVSIVIGIIFLFGSFSGITGYSIGSESGTGFGYFLGALFLTIGIVLIIIGRNYGEREMS